MKISIKDKYKTEVVGYRNSGIPLGQRSEDDLKFLGILAHERNPKLKEYFQDLPTLEELKEDKTETFLQQYAGDNDE